MRLNWESGFNRVFLVATFGWVGYALWYVPVHQWHTEFDIVENQWSFCVTHGTAVDTCNAQREQDLHVYHKLLGLTTTGTIGGV